VGYSIRPGFAFDRAAQRDRRVDRLGPTIYHWMEKGKTLTTDEEAF